MMLTMLGGPPGSGKTTLREKLCQEDWYAPVFCPDDSDHYKDADGNYCWTPQRAGRAWADAYHGLGRFLAFGMGNAFFDATLLDPIARAGILNISKGIGAKVHMLWLNTPIEVCRARNDQRPSYRRVPDATYERMLKAMVIPTGDEGFDEVTLVEGG